MIFPKAFAHLISHSADYKIIGMKNREAGILNVEIIPCDTKGQPLSQKDTGIINDPKNQLLNKNLNFMLKINNLKNLNDIYEDVYCQFSIFNDPTIYRTTTLKKPEKVKGYDFKFSKQFTFYGTAEVK